MPIIRHVPSIFVLCLNKLIQFIYTAGVGGQSVSIRLLWNLPIELCHYYTAFVLLTGRINAFLKRAFRYGFAIKLLEVNTLLDSASKDLFSNMQMS